MKSISIVTTFLLLLAINGLAYAKCNADWQQYGDYCYTIPSSNLSSPNFNDSLSVCTDILGNLPTFNRRKDWTDFVAFALANNLTGVSALGYMKYINNSHYTSMYNGHSPSFANWGREQPNLLFTFALIRYSSNNFWETGDWTTNPLKIVCQQGLVYDSNTTYIPCAPVSRCFSGTGLHRFTTDPYNCVSGGLVMENLNIGVAPSIHIPLLTESLYEMIESGFENVLMAYNTTGRNIAIGYGYVTNRVIRVIKVQHNATVPYFLLWGIKVPIDSVVTPLNEEYNNLKSVFWDTAAADFYMFPPKPRAGSCDLFQRSTASSITSRRHAILTLQLGLKGNWIIVSIFLISLLSISSN